MADATRTTVEPDEMRAEDYRELYTQVCESCLAIDEERDRGGPGARQRALMAVALFGIGITLGLFAYEIHGIAAVVAVWVFIGLVTLSGRAAVVASAGTLLGLAVVFVLAAAQEAAAQRARCVPMMVLDSIRGRR